MTRRNFTDDLLTPEEAAHLLGISPEVMQRLIDTGEVPGYRRAQQDTVYVLRRDLAHIRLPVEATPSASRPQQPQWADGWVSAEDIAKMLEVDGQTVKRWMEEGQLPGFRSGRKWYAVRRELWIRRPDLRPFPMTVRHLSDHDIPDALLTVEEAAAQLRRDTSDLQYLIASGELPTCRVGDAEDTWILRGDLYPIKMGADWHASFPVGDAFIKVEHDDQGRRRSLRAQVSRWLRSEKVGDLSQPAENWERLEADALASVTHPHVALQWGDYLCPPSPASRAVFRDFEEFIAEVDKARSEALWKVYHMLLSEVCHLSESQIDILVRAATQEENEELRHKAYDAYVTLIRKALGAL